ncbi:PRC-barrel domain containing protein [Glaciecola sp. XM2]|jgi:sporulation protein YlmC with PRC-barrel domain|uniref:PRC-barrel domain-containing protein n=1 Tax=Glaciecola sp. XM2 TaxID=1914931 RepID=UPI001BDE6617|nr:PRC-barrel domain-containing protein [Glaciecola sp. XM2]MBT1451767.1 PRC-barrel domain containing protein [Glaciecola sp. XM2]
MNLSLNKLLKYDIDATDGDIGYLKDVLFDDQQWIVRYIIIDTKRWMPLSQKVLISPIAVRGFDIQDETLSLSLTKQHILDSPPIEAHKPVSEQFEKAYFDFFGYGYYWNGLGAWGDFDTPTSLIERSVDDTISDSDNSQQPSDPIIDRHLRSINELRHYSVVETDGMKGRVHDFILDTDTWTIKYFVIGIRNWLPGGHIALLPPEYLASVSWKDQAVFCELNVAQVKQLPEYDEDMLNNEAYLASVHSVFEGKV